MAGKPWTQEELDFLVAETQKDVGCKEIAKYLGRTTRSVQHKFGQLGLEKPHPKVGDTINYLTILEIVDRFEYGQNISYAICRCKCSEEKGYDVIHECKLTYIKYGQVKSCSCWKAEKASQTCKEKNYKHGMGDLKDRLYRIWCNMKARCRDKSLMSYGGKGISVCDEWMNYAVFYKWSMENGYKENLTIDRIDNNGNYCPENCRWADYFQQANNKSNNNYVTAFGETKTLAQWIEDDRCQAKYGGCISYRIDAGWTSEDAITIPTVHDIIKHEMKLVKQKNN